MFNAYKQAARGSRFAGAGRGPVLLHGIFATLATPLNEDAYRIGQKIPWFLTVSIKSSPQMSKFQPGQLPPEMTPAAWRAGASKRPTDLSVEALIRQGQMFCGNPDTVVRQIKEFRQRVGGVGRIIMMTRQGLVSGNAEATKSLLLLAAKEVLPQLQGLVWIDAGYDLGGGAMTLMRVGPISNLRYTASWHAGLAGSFC